MNALPTILSKDYTNTHVSRLERVIDRREKFAEKWAALFPNGQEGSRDDSALRKKRIETISALMEKA